MKDIFRINFSGVWEDFPAASSIDLSDMGGTSCYCDAQSAVTIRSALKEAGPKPPICLLDSGDYHYLSFFLMEEIPAPFELMLFDNHPDDQPGAFGEELLSCGGWVASARKHIPSLRSTVWVDGRGGIHGKTDTALPVYLSVDLDILSPEYALTDWDQGTLSLGELCSAISESIEGRVIAGADICGGISKEKGGTPSDSALNIAAALKLADVITARPELLRGRSAAGRRQG